MVGRAQSHFAGLDVDLLKVSPDVEFTGYITDEELIALYRGAAGFLYPSFEEGFGLPVIEAFYCGCPVLTSNKSCLPEVTGNAALLVDPTNPELIAGGMRTLALRKEVAAELQALGYRRAAAYNWQRAGDAIEKILQQAVR